MSYERIYQGKVQVENNINKIIKTKDDEAVYIFCENDVLAGLKKYISMGKMLTDDVAMTCIISHSYNCLHYLSDNNYISNRAALIEKACEKANITAIDILYTTGCDVSVKNLGEKYNHAHVVYWAEKRNYK